MTRETNQSRGRSAYHALEARFARAGALRAVLGLLDWDASVMMPAPAAEARGAQAGVLQDLLGETLSDPALEDLCQAAEAADLDPWARANLREMRRDLRLAAATPGVLAARLAEAARLCERAWRAARIENDAALVRQELETVIGLAREIAAARGAALGLQPFDAMMEVHEPGARSKTLEPLFEDLARRLPALLAAAPDGPERVDDDGDDLSPEQRLHLARALANALGLGPETVRIDPTAHAFFMDDNPGDPRIGVRLEGCSTGVALKGLLHEIGHVRYEGAVPARWRAQPVGRPRSAALQESQALLMERLVGGSSAFWRALGPRLARTAGPLGARLARGAAAAPRRRSGLTPIRVEADDLSYGLHIVLRFRLERDLIEGRLAVRDLPEAWREASRALFGFAPKSDQEGCLQDIHWHRALFGYFPSYAQGQWAACQFLEAAERDLPGLFEDEGRFEELAAWLFEHVHVKASLLETEDLLREATGAALGTEAFFRRMGRRYVEGRD
jgi:carboxypeptidase Taq